MKSARNPMRVIALAALLCIVALVALQVMFARNEYNNALTLVMKTTSSADYPSGDAALQLEELSDRLQSHTIAAVIAGAVGYIILLGTIHFALRWIRMQRQADQERMQEKELELSLATNRFEKMCSDLAGSAIAEKDVMHNHASLSNWLDNNYHLFTRRSSEAILGSHMSTALVLIEADDLMELNQQHGLEAGDAALSALSEQLKQHTRKNDIVARWQEGTFLVVLHDITLKNALGRAEELRAGVEQMEIPLQRGTLRLTITCGLSMMLDVDKSWKQALNRAQRALNRGREGSKNTICHEIFQ